MAQTTTLTLVEFLTARLDEDEAVASSQMLDWSAGSMIRPLAVTEAEAIYPHKDAARVLREVEAKRAILAEHSPEPNPYDNEEPGCTGCALGMDEEYRATISECATLRALATVYADHPDYRDEWRP